MTFCTHSIHILACRHGNRTVSTWLSLQIRHIKQLSWWHGYEVTLASSPSMLWLHLVCCLVSYKVNRLKYAKWSIRTDTGHTHYINRERHTNTTLHACMHAHAHTHTEIHTQYTQTHRDIYTIHTDTHTHYTQTHRHTHTTHRETLQAHTHARTHRETLQAHTHACTHRHRHIHTQTHILHTHTFIHVYKAIHNVTVSATTCPRYFKRMTLPHMPKSF